MTDTTTVDPAAAREAFVAAVLDQGDSLGAYRTWLAAVRDHNTAVDRRVNTARDLNAAQLDECAQLRGEARKLGGLAAYRDRVIGRGTTTAERLYPSDEYDAAVQAWRTRLAAYVRSVEGRDVDTSNLAPSEDVIPPVPYLTPDGGHLVEPASYSR